MTLLFPAHALSIALSLAGSDAAQVPPPPEPAAIRRLDGSFDDWRALDASATKYDRAGDFSPAADLTTMSLASDPRALWIYLEFAHPVSLQALDMPVTLVLNADGDDRTGPNVAGVAGSDMAVVFSPVAEVKRPGDGGGRSAQHGEGTSVHRINPDGTLGPALPHETTGVSSAPTHASRRFEIRLPRETLGIGGMTTTARAAVMEQRSDGVLQLLEDVEIVRSLMVPRSAAPNLRLDASAARALVQRHPDADARVVTWNVERGKLFASPEGFAASLKALAPDAVLFQELGPKATAVELATWMNANVGGDGEWQALVSGGDLRVGIAARRPLATAAFLDGLRRGAPGSERPIRAIGATAEIDGVSVLFVSLHLKCCGRLGSTEDTARNEETARLHEAIRASAQKAAYGAVVITGDFNLVGDPDVLAHLGDGLDLDGSSLDVVNAYQLDGETNATWRSAGSPFVSGRLDYGVVSGTSAEVVRTFVFSVEDLGPEAIAALSLPPSALAEPSDHMPMVFDLRLRAPAASAPSPAPGPGATP